jgi:hypothetical protein
MVKITSQSAARRRQGGRPDSSVTAALATDSDTHAEPSGDGPSQPILLGGSASPIGWWVTFVEAPLSAVELWLANRWFEGRPFTATELSTYPACLGALEPLESPWTKHLLIEVGDWTMHLSNSLLGGDPSAPGPALSTALERRVVIAGHSQRHGPGHEGTALWVLGPEGEPPLHYVRTVQVDCADGRWSWHESGAPLHFENVDRYSARRKRDRFDRALLIDYLAAYQLFPDDPATFGNARLISGEPTTGRSVPVAQLRHQLGLN